MRGNAGNREQAKRVVNMGLTQLCRFLTRRNSGAGKVWELEEVVVSKLNFLSVIVLSLALAGAANAGRG